MVVLMYRLWQYSLDFHLRLKMIFTNMSARQYLNDFWVWNILSTGKRVFGQARPYGTRDIYFDGIVGNWISWVFSNRWFYSFDLIVKRVETERWSVWIRMKYNEMVIVFCKVIVIYYKPLFPLLCISRLIPSPLLYFQNYSFFIG